jgi:hypothetical protein
VVFSLLELDNSSHQFKVAYESEYKRSY